MRLYSCCLVGIHVLGFWKVVVGALMMVGEVCWIWLSLGVGLVKLCGNVGSFHRAWVGYYLFCLMILVGWCIVA